MTELEEGLVFHGCENAREKFQRRNFKITEIIERRSSYANNEVKYEDLETGETSSVSQGHLEGRLESGDFREDRFETCEHCRPGGCPVIDPQRRLEQLAAEHNMAPRFLRDIVYLSGIGYHQSGIDEKADMSQDTVVKYRRKLREMSEEEATEIFELVAEVKKPLAEAEQQKGDA